MSTDNCCITSCDKPIDQNYWDSQYQAQTIGWDLGMVSPAMKMILDKIESKNTAILIPGCGNSYEADYLLNHGFTNITILDISPTLVENLKQKYVDKPHINIILGDFFEHNEKYDYIVEQTFFCALPKALRQRYVWKTNQLLAPKGILTGLLFNREFEVSPPFGGSLDEYKQLFSNAFYLNKIEPTANSVIPRSNTELTFEFQKNDTVSVNLFQLKGVTCGNCSATIIEKFTEITQILQTEISIDFSNLLVVSNAEVAIDVLKEKLSFDSKYEISEF
jgi:methyl halide transferase